MLANLAKSLIAHKRIKTTVPKAKALRKYVEPIITRAKSDNTHSRRMVFSDLGDKESVKELFITVADKIGDRPGGYTRIIKLGNRLGDNADMAMIELVDFNEHLLEEKAKSGKRKRRRRGGSKKASDQSQASSAEETSETTEESTASSEETSSENASTSEEGNEGNQELNEENEVSQQSGEETGNNTTNESGEEDDTTKQ